MYAGPVSLTGIAALVLRAVARNTLQIPLAIDTTSVRNTFVDASGEPTASQRARDLRRHRSDGDGDGVVQALTPSDLPAIGSTLRPLNDEGDSVPGSQESGNSSCVTASSQDSALAAGSVRKLWTTCTFRRQLNISTGSRVAQHSRIR